jgi:gliding motility-associated-like protein
VDQVPLGLPIRPLFPEHSINPTGPNNNSAHFNGTDLVIICAGNYFCYDFGAIDLNTTDSLAYSFCNAYTGGTSGNPAPNPPAAPPYTSVPYAAPFQPGQPMGPAVNLDPRTGMMCGVAPPAGIYVVTVCVTEYRDGQAIAVQRKDLQIKIGDCNLVKTVLPTSYPICDDFTRTFENLAPANNLVHTYAWEFGPGGNIGKSNQSNPTFTFPDTGRYVIKLVINRNEPCGDSTTTIANVYPGFFPGFGYVGVCAGKPTVFHDSTRTVYGFVNSWSWDFGVNSTLSDTSHQQHPSYTYATNGNYSVNFIVTSSKGCIDTLTKPITIMDKPPISVAFEDTLICNGDAVPLQAFGNGNFSWTPLVNIVGANTANPTVSPTTTTNYFVQLNDNGCINNDTVRVRVVNFVTLSAMADTVICLTDSLTLKANTDGLRFAWSPTAGMNDPTLQNPKVLPTQAVTIYTVVATIGHCNASDDIKVTTVPYPKANAGADTVICYKAEAQLNASITGNSFSWSPTGSLINANTLNPRARPPFTVAYILTVFDTQGCPKPGRDTVLVTVLPKVNAFAGRDTAVVEGQPLQFNATGGVSYQWSPGTNLSNTSIFNPIGIYDGGFDSIRYKVVVKDANGCADSATVKVRIFKTNPSIFVPSAFTPNGDGKNDFFRPIAVGITKIDYFSVYNRWGELVFTTTQNEKGWDGRIAGKEQGSGTFVWMVKGTDFTGKVVTAKGTVTLLR